MAWKIANLSNIQEPICSGVQEEESFQEANSDLTEIVGYQPQSTCGEDPQPPPATENEQ